MALTKEKLVHLRKIVLEIFPELTDIMIAVAEKESTEDIAVLIKGSDVFREQILLFLAENSRTAKIIKIPVEKIFPPTPKNEVN